MKENKIIAHLIKLPLHEIYNISPKQYFERGFEYYKAGRLKYLNWSDDYRVLTAGVEGGRIYSVSFFIDSHGLGYRCNCPAWSADTNCKHVVCALLGTKNIIDPESFNIGRQSELYRNTLKACLLPYEIAMKSEAVESKTLSVYSILLEKKTFAGFLGISVEIAGSPVSRYHRLPPELDRLTMGGRYLYPADSTTFLEYLRRHGNTHPIFVKIKDEKVPVEWDEALICSPMTWLNASRDTVTVRRICISGDKTYPNIFHPGNDFIIDLETRRLGVLNNKGGWDAWRFLLDVLENDKDWTGSKVESDGGHAGFIETPVIIPLEKFRDIQFSVKNNVRAQILKNLVLSVDNVNVTPAAAECGYCMTIDMHGNEPGKMVLKGYLTVDGFKADTTRSFFDFLPSVVGRKKIVVPAVVQEQRATLVAAFLRLLSAKNDREAVRMIKDILSADDFADKSAFRHANSLLIQAWSSLKAESSRLIFNSGGWHLADNNREREALLYTIPFDVFGVELFDGLRSHNEFVISAERLHKHLPELHAKFKGHGIVLLFKGKPVEVSRWDFSMDCTRGSAIDWFEIRPEIRCDGVLIDEEKWKKAFGNNGVVEDEGFITILDSNSQEILNAIASYCDERDASRFKVKEIVRIPRLRILDLMHLRNQRVSVTLSREDEDLIERLDSFDRIEDKPVPERLNAKLRPYQRDGYSWLSFLYEHRFGACLADDMGLGKTLQTIALLAGIKEGKVRPAGGSEGPHILVLPPSLLFNWQSEIMKFYPGLGLHFYTGKDRTTEFEGSDVVLTTYGLVRRDIEKLRDIQFNIIIFDEAQAVKNIYAHTTCAVRQLKGYFKLTLTGTPVENHVGEYYSILDLTLPGLLGEYESFKSGIKTDIPTSLEPLLRKTKPFVLRRTKEAVLKDLPPKTESDIYLDLTDKQKALYKKTVEAVKSTISKAYENNTEAQARLIALTAILKLRQLCVSPGLIDPDFSDPSPKIEFLIGKLKELVDEGHSALVFSQFTSFLDILEDDLKKNGLVFCRLDGSTPVRERKKLVEGFQNGMAPVFLLSLKAGGQGLNLTRASYVFHLDPWWNPAVENQASDRAHRIGQKNKVTITRILMRHTIEEKMMELKKKKLSLYMAVMGNSVTCRRGVSISRSDFDYLLDAAMIVSAPVK